MTTLIVSLLGRYIYLCDGFKYSRCRAVLFNLDTFTAVSNTIDKAPVINCSRDGIACIT